MEGLLYPFLLLDRFLENRAEFHFHWQQRYEKSLKKKNFLASAWEFFL
jgi:hypothetical protein